MKYSERKMINHPVFDKLIVLLILLNVVAVILESTDTIYSVNSQAFIQFRTFSYAIFTLEYFVRIYRCIVNKMIQVAKPFARLRMIFSPVIAVDAFVILLFYLKINIGIDLRLLRLFRVLSILQVMQNSRSLHILQAILVREKRTLLSTLFIMSVLVVIEAAIIYALEHQVQPEVFSSIPEAIWWTMTTLTTVGYGDAVPITPLGKFFGIIVMFVGIAMFAIPTGILVSAFYQEIKRKDFIATWDLVAQVPFFAKLTATEIARIADLLSLHVVRAGEVIFHKGDQADCMYFIVDGEVEINKPGKTICIKGGDFFGEIGILYDIPRNADVTANTYTELLMLNSRDIELFMEYHPQLRERILEASETRRQ
ncbi:MAG: cyclic nucleotide-binding domain-containing protein [Methylomarinum sp.]|nr:cyclic nucleotide-binding domain-containing protein [Methylomarinum sp.]